MEERAQLIAAIAADPDALENWIVYADWLSEHDDPRGELITVEMAREHESTTSGAIIERHRELMTDPTVWLSPALRAVAESFDLKLWRGFIRRAEANEPTRDALEALFSDPHACLLQKLKLDPDAQPFEPRPMRWVDELELSTVDGGELPLAEAFPALTLLNLGFESNLEVLVHPRLHTIAGSAPALSTGRFDLPNLEVFRYDEEVPFDVDGLLNHPPPRLTEMVIGEAPPDLIDSLRASLLLAQLKTLRIGTIDRATLHALEEDPAPFHRLDLYYNNVSPLDDEAPLNLLADRDAYQREYDLLQAAVTAALPNARRTEYSHDAGPEVDAASTQALGDAMAQFAQRLKSRPGA